MDLRALFQDHLELRLACAGRALAASGHDALVISSGVPFMYYADDHEAPFQGVAHFRHYCPIEGPHHVLKLEPGRRPLLVRYVPVDYWNEQVPMDGAYWADAFEIVEAPTPEAVWERVGRPARTAYLGDEPARAEAAGLAVHPPDLEAILDWGRSFKTPYEIQALEAATELAARGHEASRRAFLAGGSEVEIHHAFVQAVDCMDHELAFPSIVALEPKGATLHYRNKRHGRNGKVLLLDCGARVRGYASDITRTSFAPDCDPRFTALAGGLKQVQRRACAAMLPGVPFLEVHHLALRALGEVLQQAGITDAGPEEAFDKGFTRTFMPHGLGHFLGITIHDVAGRATGPEGGLLQPPAQDPALRVTRTLAPGQVLTVEPGLYFIPMLLRRLREGPDAARFDWKLIDALTPLGGIRFEDNIVMTAAGARNLTQEHLPSWQEH